MSASPLGIRDFASDRARPRQVELTRRLPIQWMARLAGMRHVASRHVFLILSVLLLVVVIVAAAALLWGEDPRSASVMTDNVVRLHARDIGKTCWRGTNAATMRMAVMVEIGQDGAVRSAASAGGSPTMRGCVETHVRAWEFLPQAAPTKVILPFEIDTL